jgi:glycosyltransferase involved in cell wall biosynthesis
MAAGITSLDILRQLAQSNPRLKVISLPRNFGQHPAIAAAIDHAEGDVGADGCRSGGSA